ncbi:MAG TPA: hypothetical protein VF412_16815 [Bdellovibrio sp.]|uniref:hypothetical protein n=1 Tax=Bdellovibrio sp. TaxID=28201 RepID=UPI002F21BA5A
MRHFGRIIIFLLLAAGQLASAKITEAECSFKDYSDRFVPPKDQGNAGFCYSFAASDLLSEAASVKPPDTVSAFHVASQYISMSQDEVKSANAAISFDNPAIPANISMGAMMGNALPGISTNYRFHDPSGKPLLKREGGQTDLIAAHLIENGHVCLEREVPSELIGRNYKDSEQQNFFSIQMGTLGGGHDVEKFFGDKPLYNKLQNSCVANPPLDGLNQMVPLKEAIQDWAAQKLRTQSENLCKHPVSTKGLTVHSRSFTSQEKNPNAIKYMMSVLDNDRPFALHYDLSIMMKWPPNISGWHSSIVTGRRWNKEKQTCELAIKNSWGENCDSEKEPGTCEKGRWWLDTDKLADSKSEVIWIDKGK